MLKRLFFLVVLICTQSVYAESLRFTTLNAASGLPQNTIRAIAQDQNGFMWFATEDGIARYDGHEITAYRYDPQQPNSLLENVAYQFLPEGKSRLWISTQGEGVAVLDYSTGLFSSVTDMPGASKNSQIGVYASALYLRSRKEMLVGSENGVFSVSTETLQVERQIVTAEQMGNGRVINLLWEDRDGALWIGSEDGKLAFIQDNQLQMVRSPSERFYRRASIEGIGDVLAAGRNGLLVIDYQKKALVPLFHNTFLKGRDIKDVVSSPDGKLWIASSDGLIRYDRKSKVAVIAAKNSADENSLPTNDLTTLYINEEKVLWIGTGYKGVSSVNLTDYGFSSYSAHNLEQIYPKNTNSRTADSFNSNVIWSIFRDSAERLWIGHNEGVSLQLKGEETYTNLSALGAIDIDSIWSIEEADGFLWFGTWGDGLIRYHPESGEAIIYSTEEPIFNQFLSGNVIRLLLYDKKRNSLWVGTHYNGLNQIDFNNQKVYHFLPREGDNNSLPHKRIRSLYLDKQKRLWVGTGDGVALFDNANKKFYRVKKKNEETAADVRGIYQSDENTLWISTGNGLDKVDIHKRIVEQKFLEQDGLSRSALYSIIPDAKGRLWIPTLKGLTRFDPKTLQFVNFFTVHHLQSDEFNFNASWKNTDGSIILGGMGGITLFDPLQVKDVYESHSPIILDITSFDGNLIETKEAGRIAASITEEPAFILSPEKRKIIIDFTLPEYVFPNKVRYQYRLVGNESEWSNAFQRDVPIQYTNLRPGKYLFQIKTMDDTELNNNMLTVSFRIKYYIWERWWFWVLVLTLFFLFILWMARIYLKNKLERKIARESSNVYKMIVHDLGPSLIRNADNITILLKSEMYYQELYKEILDDFNIENMYALSFIDQLRDLSSVERSFIKQKNSFLLEDLVYESMSLYKKEEHRIVIKDIPDVSVLVYENNIQFIIKNLISNAVKYSDKNTSIVLELHIDRLSLEIWVSDEGSGVSDKLKKKVIEPYERGDKYTAEGLGLGLSLIKSIAAKYKGRVEIRDNEPKGSIVIVLLNNVIIR